MQNEREPDIMGPDSEALEEKVREMMDPEPKKSKPSDAVDASLETKDKTAEMEVGTAPEVTGLPMSKEPLKIKILSPEPDEEDSVTAESKKLPAKQKAKKKIPVTHDTTDSEAALTVESESPETGEAEVHTPEEETVIPDEALPPEIMEAEASEPETMAAEEETEPAEPMPEAVAEETTVPPLVEDDKTKEAVDDIVAHEGDEILAYEDEKKAAFEPPKTTGLSQRLKSFFSIWWHNPKTRWLTFIFLFVVFGAACAVPTSRYFMLNTVRVRSSASLIILDNSTEQPLKNVKVSVNDVSGVTGTDGRVQLARVKLGTAKVKIEKRAFAPIEQQITIGWGSNPLGEYKLVPTGTQYAFVVTDYLSAKGIEGVQASSGEANASSDKNGKILLTMDQPPDVINVTLQSDGYRQETVKLNADIKTEQPVKLVPARRDVFISKRSGTYDVYKIDIDGKNETKILAGTGSERDDMLLLPHPSDEVVAVVSTRGNIHNKDGFLLSTLTIIDLSDNSTSAPAQSEQIRLLGWVGDHLIYMQAAAGASASNPKRQRLMSYNYKTDENKELFTSNYFNDLAVIGTKIYFAPSSAYQTGNIGLFSLDVDGTNRQTLLNQEVWNIIRTSYDHLILSVGQDWYDLRLGDKVPVKLPGQPANLNPRAYIDSPNGKKSLWVDNRDGKGVLLTYEPSTQNEQVLRTQGGLKNPVRWLNDNVVVYRISTEQETADYALSLLGGEPHKIRDVTHISGTDNWYYY